MRAILHHPDLAVALDDLRLDFADLLVHQVAPVFFAGDDGFARFFHACRDKANRSAAASQASAWIFSQDFSSGLSDHFGVKEGLGLRLLKN